MTRKRTTTRTLASIDRDFVFIVDGANLLRKLSLMSDDDGQYARDILRRLAEYLDTIT